MTISSLIFHSSPLLLTNKTHYTPFSKRFLTNCKLQTTTTQLSKDHKLSWRHELERVYGPELSKYYDNAELFQDVIDQRCIDNVRMLIIDAVQHAKTGHPGMALGMAEVGYLLYRHAMRYNPKNPKWLNKDRFLLSAGHGCLLQYVCLKLAGFGSVQLEDLKRLCKLGSSIPGHLENVMTAGVEATTGPLGQAVANAIGFALAKAHLAARFNKPNVVIIDHRTYCIMGDRCVMEGVSNEAASLAAHWKLNKLILIYEDNHNTIDGDTSLTFSEDISARFKDLALGWNTITVENIHQDIGLFRWALLSTYGDTQKPTFIKLKTMIGRLSRKEGTAKAHHGTFDDEDVEEIRVKVKWEDCEPFHVIPMVYCKYQLFRVQAYRIS